MVRNCRLCEKNAPMIISEPPRYSWQKIGSDLFEFNGHCYMVIVDYFSRYIEATRLLTATSAAVINALKFAFSRLGIPELLISDNGPQFVSQDMKEFSKAYDFTHISSSPRYPQSNGQAERVVQTVKRLLNALRICLSLL